MNRSCCLCLLLSIVPAQLAWADESLRLYQEHQRENEERLLEQRLRQLKRSAPAPAAPDDTLAGSDHACWQVSGLQITGNQRLSSARITSVAVPWLQPCMGVSQINQVLKAITTLYLEAGYVSSRPYLVRQPEDGQPLEIMIIEGFVEAIEISDPDLPLSLSSAFPGMLGEPLQLRDLEQGMDQLNRLRAFDLTADVGPGEFEGGSRVVVRPRSKPSRWQLQGSLANSGSDSVARQRTHLSVSLDSPTHSNDLIGLSYAQSLKGVGESRLVAVNYQIPYGRWTLRADAIRSESDSLLTQRSQFLHSELAGQSVNVDRVLWRDGQSLINGHLKWSHQKRANRIGEFVMRHQALDLERADIGLSAILIGEETRFGQSMWTLGGSYAWGLKGAARFANDVEPRFEKYHVSGRWQVRGKGLSRPWFLISQLDAQYSSDRLPDLEHLGLTGPGAVRGFRDTSANSASGIVWQSTLTLPGLRMPIGEIVPFLGLDAAVAKHHHQDAKLVPSVQRLAGATAGVTLHWRDSRLRLSYQHALRNSHAIRLEPGFWLTELSFAL
ncbi:ShlB/FhaC/HecB family hemolysin secretion/activation protein [Pseudomonas sp. dw_358]|uniref:ShlB/FhaC/HecB family hemolysin secretion/activation protein n=1 Tax=Pseudomonas sp. dw_358 TaxID=2720083 RepID=UPI002116CCF2|nr:ShlB/FhaC/HecB family hemolysin secretion/activation protein [Pseudomonas sp. dw_358]